MRTILKSISTILTLFSRCAWNSQSPLQMRKSAWKSFLNGLGRILDLPSPRCSMANQSMMVGSIKTALHMYYWKQRTNSALVDAVLTSKQQRFMGHIFQRNANTRFSKSANPCFIIYVAGPFLGIASVLVHESNVICDPLIPMFTLMYEPWNR
jgi:hypothetical protein